MNLCMQPHHLFYGDMVVLGEIPFSSKKTSFPAPTLNETMRAKCNVDGCPFNVDRDCDAECIYIEDGVCLMSKKNVKSV